MSLCIKALQANGLSLSVNGKFVCVMCGLADVQSVNKETCIGPSLIPFSFGNSNCRRLKELLDMMLVILFGL